MKLDQQKKKLDHTKVPKHCNKLISRQEVGCENEGAVGSRGGGRGGTMELAGLSKHVQKTTEPRDLQGKLFEATYSGTLISIR